MSLPTIPYADGYTKTQQTQFGGYNHTRAAGDGELWDMGNLWAGNFPALSVRPRRALVTKLTKPNGLAAGDHLAWVDGTSLYYDGRKVGDVADSEKQMCFLGDRLVIFPDKVVYNAYDDSLTAIETSFSSEAGKVTFGNGTYTGEPADANELRCEDVDFSTLFRVGDGVTITGCILHPENNRIVVIREFSEDGHSIMCYENSFVLSGENGMDEYTEPGTVTIKRECPTLNFVFTHENRVWGCDDSTMYASKFADPFNFYAYDGLDSSSWFSEDLAPGNFTSGVSYYGYPCFFKNDQIYKVYGAITTEFRHMGAANLGVEPGSGNSPATAGETLFYLSRAGVVRYKGGLPHLIDTAFGDEEYHNAVGGTDGKRYYISMHDTNDVPHLFVYETDNQAWYRHDGLDVKRFAWCDGLFALCENGELWYMGHGSQVPEGAVEEGPVEWFAETADFTDGSPNRKGVNRLEMRCELDEGTTMTVKIQFDSGAWQTIKTITAQKKQSHLLPIIPRRCDHYRIRIEGKGDAWIYGLTRNRYEGSELH